MNGKTVTCIGEVLIDFVSMETGCSLAQAGAFRKLPGGAPANVAAGIARLGTSSAFVGAVGKDQFGDFLVDTLAASGVGTRQIQRLSGYRTRLAFVSIMPDGGRDFSFWEQEPADEHLRLDRRLLDTIARSGIVHISSFTLLKEPLRSEILKAMAYLKRKGTVLSFDPNFRQSLWRSSAEAKKALTAAVRMADIVRMNDEESRFLTGSSDTSRAASSLLKHGPRLVVITRGVNGCEYWSREAMGMVAGFPVDAVDTTGCGDAFLAGLLHRVMLHGGDPGTLTGEQCAAACRYANAVGALTATQPGAMSALPDKVAVEHFLATMGGM